MGEERPSGKISVDVGVLAGGRNRGKTLSLSLSPRTYRPGNARIGGPVIFK